MASYCAAVCCCPGFLHCVPKERSAAVWDVWDVWSALYEEALPLPERRR
jgi:hypothetical protein